MKNYIKLILFVSSLFAFSCVVESPIDLPNANVEKTSLDDQPGFGLSLLDLYGVDPFSNAQLLPQSISNFQQLTGSNSQYTTSWDGQLTIDNVIYRTGNVVDGEQVYEYSIVDNGYVGIHTIGPYFIIEKPTYIGALPFVSNQEVSDFHDALESFYDGELNSSGSLVQPYLPSISDYVNTSGASSSGIIITTGQIIRSNNSPSTFAVVSEDYIPTPPPVASPFVIGYFMQGGLSYHIITQGFNWPLGSTGIVTNVIALDSNYDPVNLLGFEGSFQKVASGYAMDLTVYKDADTEFDFDGVVDGF